MRNSGHACRPPGPPRWVNLNPIGRHLTLGERLDVTRQSAHEHFARAVEEVADGVLFPLATPATRAA